MANVLLTVKSNKPSAPTITLIDGETTTGYRLMGVDLGSTEYDLQFSGMRGTQGARLAGATALNRLSVWRLQTVGNTEDDLEAKLSVLWGLDEELRRFGGTVTWRPQGSSFRMYLDVLSSGCKVESYDDLWPRDHRLTVSFGVVTPPYMEGDPYDIVDDFATDTEARYTFDTGSASDVAVTGGSLTASGNLTVEKRLIHTDRGYTYGDQQVTLKATPGSTITSFKAGVVLKRIDANNYLEVYVDDNGTNSRLRLDKIVAGSRTNLSTTNLAARVVNGTPFWVRGRIEGNVLFLEHFAAAPTPMVTPTTSANYTLTTGAEQTSFGIAVEGLAGLSWIPQQAAALIDDLAVEPFTYRNVTGPDDIRLRGVIDGDALALLDAYITPSGGAAAPIWALLGWTPQAAVHNMLIDGDLEGPQAGVLWSVAAVTNINGAATSKSVVTTAAKYGLASLQVVCPATTDTGANFRIFRKFRRGITYTFEVWVRSAAGTTNVYARLGNGTANDKATSGNTALSTTWQRLTVAWTPTADRDDAHIAINIAAATGTTFTLDGAMVYEGTVAPTSANQSEGRGGFPPFGVIEAENTWAGTNVSANANYRSGFGVIATGGTASCALLCDPALILQDDYTQNEIAVEVWARVSLQSSAIASPTVALSASSLNSAITRYAEEFGSAVKTITRPSAGSAFRLIRCGTLRLPTTMGRWLINLVATSAPDAGNLAIDYLVLVPANARALGTSGKTNDANYPKFASATTETIRRIRSDLSGTYRDASSLAEAEQAYSGLGGSLLELPAGSVDAVVKLSSLVPDDSTSDTSTEQLAHSATVHFAITPRWRLGRSA
jgi:hypothetical protein